MVLATSNSTLDHQSYLVGGFIFLGEVYYHSKAYPGASILPGLCSDIVAFVWNYHVLALPYHVRFWNRNQNLWSRLHIYKAHIRFRNIFYSLLTHFWFSCNDDILLISVHSEEKYSSFSNVFNNYLHNIKFSKESNKSDIPF